MGFERKQVTYMSTQCVVGVENAGRVDYLFLVWQRQPMDRGRKKVVCGRTKNKYRT